MHLSKKPWLAPVLLQTVSSISALSFLTTPDLVFPAAVLASFRRIHMFHPIRVDATY